MTTTPTTTPTSGAADLLDSDLSNLTERGAKAWAGVDAQGLRDGGASPQQMRGSHRRTSKSPTPLQRSKPR